MTATDDQHFARPPRGAGRVCAGVCAGLAERWDLPAAPLRAVFVVASLAFGAGVLLYCALALTMPERGANAARAARSAEAGQTLLLALRAAGSILALALVAGGSAALALFGLGGVALILACACMVVVIVGLTLRSAPFGAAALALTLPAAAVALGNEQIARQFGPKVVELRAPGDVDPAGYRAGTGPLLIDLRRFAADPGSSTTIRARADLRPLVVALPRNRCFSLVIDQTLDRSWPAWAIDQRGPATLRLGPPVRTPTQRERQLADDQPPSLIAFGRPILGASVRYRRPARSADAPVLHLVLTTGRSQAIVRDYPQTAHPLEHPWWPTPRVTADDRFGIPRGQTAAQTVPDDPLVPRYLQTLDRRMAFLAANPSAGSAAELTAFERPAGVSAERHRRLLRFLRQEVRLRAAAHEGDALAVRFAGPCAPRREQLQARSTLKVPGAERAHTRLLARWQVIRERWPQAKLALRLERAPQGPEARP